MAAIIDLLLGFGTPTVRIVDVAAGPARQGSGAFRALGFSRRSLDRVDDFGPLAFVLFLGQQASIPEFLQFP